MDRNKTGVVVLFLLVGFFFLGIAMVFNTSVRRNAVLKRQKDIEEKIASLNAMDLTIYWIGDVPEELESLKPKINIIKPDQIRNDNMPIKSTTFHITIKGEDGSKKEIIPRDYSEFMLIVINTGSDLTDDANEVLRNCIVDNGVPVLCIGGKPCDTVGTILIHGAGYSSDYSMLYKLKEGYEEPYLDTKAVASGGIDLAEALCNKLCEYFNAATAKKWAEASERVSSAFSSVDEAATATTAETESTESAENSSSETKRKMLVKP